MHRVKKNNLFLARLPGISANSSENYRRYDFQAFANISEKFTTLRGTMMPFPSRAVKRGCKNLGMFLQKPKNLKSPNFSFLKVF